MPAHLLLSSNEIVHINLENIIQITGSLEYYIPRNVSITSTFYLQFIINKFCDFSQFIAIPTTLSINMESLTIALSKFHTLTEINLFIVLTLKDSAMLGPR